MKKSPSKSKRLKSYSALAAGFLAIGNTAYSQMVYNDINPDVTIQDNNFYMLDLNNDGKFDFKISHQKAEGYSGSSYSSVKLDRIKINPQDENAKVFAYSSNDPYPLKLNPNESILPNVFRWNSDNNTDLVLNSARTIIANSGNDINHEYYGNWKGANNGFLGLSIKIDNKNYLGWARLDVAQDGKSFTIKDYAFSTDPDEKIKAGQWNDINDKFSLNPLLYTYQEKLYLDFETDKKINGSINLYDLSGKLIINGNINSNKEIISIDKIKSGIYVLDIEANNVKIIRKIFIN